MRPCAIFYICRVIKACKLVSARGQVTTQNHARLKALAYRCCRDARIATNLLIKNGSKAALLTSFSIFAARNEPAWIDPPPLIAR